MLTKLSANLVVAGGDTFTFDTEKLVLEAGDKIITFQPSTCQLGGNN